MALTNDDIERIWNHQLKTTIGDHLADTAIMTTLNRSATIQNTLLPEIKTAVAALAQQVTALQAAVDGLASPPPVEAVVDYAQVKAATKEALREGTGA